MTVSNMTLHEHHTTWHDALACNRTWHDMIFSNVRFNIINIHSVPHPQKIGDDGTAHGRPKPPLSVGPRCLNRGHEGVERTPWYTMCLRISWYFLHESGYKQQIWCILCTIYSIVEGLEGCWRQQLSGNCQILQLWRWSDRNLLDRFRS